MSQNAEEKITDHCEIVLVGLNLVPNAVGKVHQKIVIYQTQVPLERG
ncbi:hypothetical protein ACFQ4L_08910 [Lapidilactobacillus mulanensis]|uniref:Uncharacterized protein n=1 Tax=Lapidilactobacillus mulanensis TaxID=2485999 RepID=A0ABW4DNH7_9LACO